MWRKHKHKKSYPKLQNFAFKEGTENGVEIERVMRDISSRFQCLRMATVVLLVGDRRGCHIVKYDGIEPLFAFIICIVCLLINFN